MFFRNVCSFLTRKLTNQKTYIKFLQHFGRKTEFTPILMREQFDDNISGVTWLVKFISPLHLRGEPRWHSG